MKDVVSCKFCSILLLVGNVLLSQEENGYSFWQMRLELSLFLYSVASLPGLLFFDVAPMLSFEMTIAAGTSFPILYAFSFRGDLIDFND